MVFWTFGIIVHLDLCAVTRPMMHYLAKDQQRPIVQGAADMVSIHWQSPDTGFAKVAGRVAKVM